MDNSSITGAASVLRNDAAKEVAKGVGFFEKNPKATAIGSAIAAVLLYMLVHHFL